MKKAYTVAEIDALRRACENRYLWGNANGPRGGSVGSRSYHETDKSKVVEDQVRTYMLAGITGSDLCAEDS